MDGYPVAAGLGVNIRVCDDRVSDESVIRMYGEEIGWQDPWEYRHVAIRAVNL